MRSSRTLTLALVATLALATAAFADEQTAAKEKPPATGAKTTIAATTHHKAPQHMRLSKDEITAVQNALTKSGQYVGTADGVMNKKTEEALRVYQKDIGLRVTGGADSETLKKLGVEHKAPQHMTKTTEGSMGSSAASSVKK